MRSGGGGPFPIFVLLIFFLLAGIFGKKSPYGYTLWARFKDSMRYKIKWPCVNCGKWTWFKKRWGIITIILILLTKGKWIVFLWFYPKRCEFCNLKMRKSPASSCRTFLNSV